MKKTNTASVLSLASLALAIAITLPAVASAETLIETETSTGIQTDLNSGQGSVAPNLRATLKAKIEGDAEQRAKTLRDQMQKNETREARMEDKKPLIEARKDMMRAASTTKTERKEIHDDRKDETRDIRVDARLAAKNASTSAERWGIRREALLEAFRARQTAFVKQLQLSIRNLEQIATRVSGRIALLEQEGKDMTTAKSLMITATTKIDAAKIAVNAVASYTPPMASTTASTTVNLTRPRSIGKEASKAVREARDALKDVVQAIVRAMGLDFKTDATATTTTP